jgi:hypothetical protein
LSYSPKHSTAYIERRDSRFIQLGVSGFQNDGIGVSTAVFSRPREWYLTVRIKAQ